MNTLLVNPVSEIVKHLEREKKQQVKRYERLKYKLLRYTNHVTFLQKCRDNDVIPNFIKIRKI
jgi:hypothetical protein